MKNIENSEGSELIFQAPEVPVDSRARREAVGRVRGTDRRGRDRTGTVAPDGPRSIALQRSLQRDVRHFRGLQTVTVDSGFVYVNLNVVKEYRPRSSKRVFPLFIVQQYYRQKGFRQVTRPQEIPDSLDMCGEQIAEKLHSYLIQIVSFHNDCLLGIEGPVTDSNAGSHSRNSNWVSLLISRTNLL